MDLRDVQKQVDEYISQFSLGYFPPLVNLARLTEEVGELARELNHRYGPKTKKPGEPEQDVGLELADIIFVCVVLANQMEIDLQDAVERTLTKYQVRDADRWERKEPGPHPGPPPPDPLPQNPLGEGENSGTAPNPA